MADLNSQPLRCIRILERGSLYGPILYEVHSLWDTNEWRVKTFTSYMEAFAYRSSLLDGLAAHDELRVLWEWNSNGPSGGGEEQ